MHALRTRIERLRRDEDGYMIVEAVLVLPLLLWAFLALYTFWDAYRSVTTIQKASYTISDLISRQPKSINPAFINGMRTAMDKMILPRLTPELRVTSIVRSDARARFEVEWSCVSGSLAPKLTTTSLQLVKDRIPNMADGNTVILVETWVDYDPALDIGLTESRLQQFIVTRPRWASKIGMNGNC